MMANILPTLQSGLPVLLAQFAAALVLLGLGYLCYMRLTPFHEIALIRQGNVAAGVVAMGTLVALSLPIAATLAPRLAACRWSWSPNTVRRRADCCCCHLVAMTALSWSGSSGADQGPSRSHEPRSSHRP